MGPADHTLRLLEQIRDATRATNERLDVNTARLDNHERLFIRIAEELGAIHGTLERIDGRVVRLEAGQELGNERLEHLEAGQQVANERLGRLEVGQQVANERLERLEVGQQRVEAGLQRTNDQLGALVGLTVQVVDHQLHGDAALDELRRRVEQLERKVG